jgi:GT2 family glycosyltransferase
LLGIAVISYNRISSVLNVIYNVFKYTRSPFEFVVADDGSSDDSRAIIEAMGHRVVSGKNMGVCWNKNRAIFYLKCIKLCTSIILIEDDSWPIAVEWEADWIKAIQYYGHVNLAGNWFSDSFISGSGTPDDPIFSKVVSGQCIGYSAEALSYVGYLDTRFQGYGIGHVEHSKRFLRAGYGGLLRPTDSGLLPQFILIKSNIRVTDPGSGRIELQIQRNEKVLSDIKGEPVFRAPWRSDAEMAQFRSEIRAAQNFANSGAFDEEFYIKNYKDVANAISSGSFSSGEQHYLSYGQYEFRLMRKRTYL